MNKTLILAYGAILSVTLIFQPVSSKSQPVPSKVKHVTVFLQGAQVTREAQVNLKTGQNTFVIKGVSPRVDQQSIQAKMEGDVKVLAVSFHLNYLDKVGKSQRVKGLEEKRSGLKLKVGKNVSLLEVYTEEEKMLKANQSIGGNDNGVDVEELKAGVAFFRERLVELKEKQFEINRKINEYKEQLRDIKKELSNLNNKQSEPTGEVEIKVSSKAFESSKLSLSYLVKQAGWFPSYDIRVENVEAPIAVTYKANVFQHSGEDWDKVKLTFSSADPTQSGSAPQMSTWWLGFNNHYTTQSSYDPGSNNEIRGQVTSSDDGSPLPGVNVLIKGTTVGTTTDINGYYSIPLTSEADVLQYSYIGMKPFSAIIDNRAVIDVSMDADVEQLSEVVVTGYGTSALQGRVAGVQIIRGVGTYKPRGKKIIAATPVVKATNVEFDVEEPYTILSNGKSQSVDMVEYSVPTNYQYYSVPKLDEQAFLTARIAGWEEFNFLEGAANLFFEGKYIGQSVLDVKNVKDTLSLSLGRDKNVVVTREKVRDFATWQLIGTNKKELFGFEIDIRNKKTKTIDIVIEDQVPLPNTKEIQVTKLEDTDANHNEDTGILKWRLKVKPGESKQLILKYQVKYPKDRSLVLE